MNDLLAVTLPPSSGSAESAVASRSSATETKREPKVAFEDTPALAKLREEQRADKNRRGETEGSEASAPSETGRDEPTPPSKTDKPDATNVEAHEPDAETAVTSENDPLAGEGNEPKGDAAAALADRVAQVAEGQSRPAHEADATIPSKDSVSGQSSSVAAQESVQAEGTVVPDGQEKAVTSNATSEGAQNAGSVPSDSTDAKPAVAAGEAKEAEVAAAASGGNKEAARVASDAPTPQANESQTPQSGETTASAKTGAQHGAEKAQTTDHNGDSASAAHSVAKDNTEASGAPATDVKVDGDDTSPRRASRSDESESVVAVKANPEMQAATLSGQGKDGSLAGSGDGMKEQVGVAVSSADTSTTFAERLAGQDTSTTASEAAATKNATQSVGEQLLDSVRASVAAGDKQVTIRLDPPELGAVTVKLQEQGDQVRALVEVSRPDTRQDVERAMPELVRTLQEAGVQIRRVEVVLSEQSGRDHQKDQLFQQDTWAGQQNSQQQGDTPRHSGPAGWQGTSRTTYAGSGGRQGSPQTAVPTDRIDMLI